MFMLHIFLNQFYLDKDAKYNINETISINGWVKYDEKPASGVSVLLKLLNPNWNEIFQDQVKSNLKVILYQMLSY